MHNNYYIDTRGLSGKPLPFSQAIVKGLADGGGLFVPQELPHFTLHDILSLADLPYAKQAAYIYKAFDIDLDAETIDSLMDEAYDGNFDDEAICPIRSLDDSTHMLELWHGPTSAFKDMALQCLPLFFSTSAEKLRSENIIDHEFMILVATSGDTGKAALEGFRDKKGVSISVLYPHGGVSDIQHKQMATQAGSNVMVWAVRGNFDDCQTTAKAVFGDDAFNEKLMSEKKVALSSANSINWGRLLPQVVYYISSYARLVASGKLNAGELLDICVPTGNFGNILAAWYAKQVGTPIDKLICASNENRVLTDFINTGTYDISERDFVLTPSPSMDILVSSNLERQLFELTDRNSELIKQWMADLREQKRFRVDEKTFAALRKDFVSDSVDSTECLKTIKEVYSKHKYLLDPHTAVAYQVCENLRGENQVLIASTAHWAKFGENVYRGLHDIKPSQALPPEIENLTGSELNDKIAQEAKDAASIPEGLQHLDEKPLRFSDIIDSAPCDVEEAIEAFLK